jgi:hypothetical protein
MNRIPECLNALRWSQTSVVRWEYELRSGEELVATLRVRGFGTLATAESGDGSWTFKRVGFFQNRATIRAAGEEVDLAVFQNNTWKGGGDLRFAGGRTFKATTSFWTRDLEFSTESEEPLVRFDYGGVFRRSADVEVAPDARHLPELPLLVLFGWYLLVMLDRDAAVSAVVITG